MRQVWDSYGHVITATVVSVPVAAAMVWLLCRWRRRHLPDRTALQRSVVEVGMALGTLPWLWMTFTPTPHGRSGWQLVPLRDLTTLATASAETVVVQLVGNLLVFAALGSLLPVRWPRFRRVSLVVAVAAAGSVSIELLQAALDIGRVSSVDDVLLNTAGAGLAALASRYLWQLLVAAKLTAR